MSITVLRWVLLVPALIVSFFISHLIFQLLFPLIQQHLGIDEVQDLSIMDEVRLFGPYGSAIPAFFSVLVCYAVAPRAKIILSLIVLGVEFLFCWGMATWSIGVGLGSLILAILTHWAVSSVRKTRTDNSPVQAS